MAAALLVASAKHQRSARGGPSCGLGKHERNARSGPSQGPTKQLHDVSAGPSCGLGLLSRSVKLTNHRRLTNPANSIKGDRLGLRTS